MENFSKDMLFQIAIGLDLPQLLSLCETNSNINKKLCERDLIWHYRLEQDFGEYSDLNKYPYFRIFQNWPKKLYSLLYGLDKLKAMWNFQNSIYDLFLLKTLDISHRGIINIPKEMGYLHNLQILNLSHNKIQYLPKWISNWHGLKYLYLSNNEIEELPKEISALKNLKVLNLSNNKIGEIPKEIGELENLRVLILSDNQIINIPIEIAELKNLKVLKLSHNKIENNTKKWIKKWMQKVKLYL